MILRRYGLYYIDKTEKNALTKTDEGKVRLARMGDVQEIRWSIQNESGPNRVSRRTVPNPEAGFIKNNAQDRTRHKRF